MCACASRWFLVICHLGWRSDFRRLATTSRLVSWTRTNVRSSRTWTWSSRNTQSTGELRCKDFVLEVTVLSKRLPIVWAASIITRARKEGRIRDDFAVKTIIDELNKFRGQCGLLISYDTISIPLVYTQVVTIAVYSYFLTGLVSWQD